MTVVMVQVVVVVLVVVMVAEVVVVLMLLLEQGEGGWRRRGLANAYPGPLNPRCRWKRFCCYWIPTDNKTTS